MQPESQLRGLQRILAREVAISDLLQYLSDLDPQPWQDVVGLVPVKVRREWPLAAVGNCTKVRGTADLVLVDRDGIEALIEVKLGHSFSADQRTRYEDTGVSQLILAGLELDAPLISSHPHWRYVSLTSIFRAWTSSTASAAATLAESVLSILSEWDGLLSATFGIGNDPATPLDSIQHKFLARLCSRRIGRELKELGWETYIGVTSGGGLAIVQAWAHIQKDSKRCLIAEARWRQPNGCELRIGVDYYLPETAESRSEAWNLAIAMEQSITADALRGGLVTTQPHLSNLLTTDGLGRKPVNAAVWQEVIDKGFASKSSDGAKGGRRQHNPGFLGDGTQRFEAATAIDTSRATAQDLVYLISSSLRYLQTQLPGKYQ